MPVHVKLSSSNRIEVNIANRDDSPSRRREGPRYDYLTREEALTLKTLLEGVMARLASLKRRRKWIHIANPGLTDERIFRRYDRPGSSMRRPSEAPFALTSGRPARGPRCRA
jgi:hypothetical protein